MKKNKLKKITMLALTAALSISCLSGCGKKKETSEDAAITTENAATMSDASDVEMGPTKEGYVINEFTGEWIDESLAAQRPLCIMINNIVDAMPQSGISQADVTFEMLVEGGITRYMCVFKDYSNISKLGPVRSARHYYVQLANTLDAIYAHVGWSTYAEEEIKAFGTNNLNGLYDSVTYYRDESRVAPHNCYTNSEKLKEGIAAAGYRTEYEGGKHEKMFAFNTEDTALGNGQTASKVTTAYNDSSTRWYEYNSDDKLYYRYQYGDKQIDDQTNEQLAYKNLIVMFVQYTDIGDGLQSIDWGKTGTGYYVSDGEYEAVSWRISDGVVKYYTADGKQLKMNPGKTFVTVFDETKQDKIIFE